MRRHTGGGTFFGQKNIYFLLINNFIKKNGLNILLFKLMSKNMANKTSASRLLLAVFLNNAKNMRGIVVPSR